MLRHGGRGWKLVVWFLGRGLRSRSGCASLCRRSRPKLGLSGTLLSSRLAEGWRGHDAWSGVCLLCWKFATDSWSGAGGRRGRETLVWRRPELAPVARHLLLLLAPTQADVTMAQLLLAPTQADFSLGLHGTGIFNNIARETLVCITRRDTNEVGE